MHMDQEGNFEKMSESDWNSASDQSIITSKRPAVFDQERDRNVRFDKNQSQGPNPRKVYGLNNKRTSDEIYSEDEKKIIEKITSYNKKFPKQYQNAKN